jgi:hypothetical protein
MENKNRRRKVDKKKILEDGVGKNLSHRERSFELQVNFRERDF